MIKLLGFEPCSLQHTRLKVGKHNALSGNTTTTCVGTRGPACDSEHYTHTYLLTRKHAVQPLTPHAHTV